MANRDTIQSSADYMNYFFNIGLRGTTETTSTILGMSNTIQNILGNLAFKTSEYLTSAETAMSAFGMVAAAGFKHATQSAIEFQQATASVEAISGQQLSGNDIGQKAMDMSSKFGLAVTDMTKGLDALARAGITANESLEALLESGVQMTKFEGRDLEESINDILSTTNLLNPDLDQNSDKFADTVKKLNQQIISTSESAPINAKNIMDTLQHVGGYASETGLDQEDLFATIAQLGSKGTKGELAGTSLRAFISAGQKDTAQRALSRIGLKVSDLWDESGEAILPLSEMKKVLDEALENNHFSKQEKLEFYSDFVGYKQANQIMKIDPEGIDEYKEKINDAMSLTDKMNIILGTVQGNWSQIAETAKNFIIKVGDNILPILNLILVPIKYAVKLIDAIPFGDWIASFAIGAVAINGISVLFNSLIPTIISFTNKFVHFKETFRDNKTPSIVLFFRNMKEDLIKSKEILQDIKNFRIDKIDKRANIKDAAVKARMGIDDDEKPKTTTKQYDPVKSIKKPIDTINSNIRKILQEIKKKPHIEPEQNRGSVSHNKSSNNNIVFNPNRKLIDKSGNKIDENEILTLIEKFLYKQGNRKYFEKEYGNDYERFFKQQILKPQHISFYDTGDMGFHATDSKSYNPFIGISPTKIYDDLKNGAPKISFLQGLMGTIFHELGHTQQFTSDYNSSSAKSAYGYQSYNNFMADGKFNKEFEANYVSYSLLKEIFGISQYDSRTGGQYVLGNYYQSDNNNLNTQYQQRIDTMTKLIKENSTEYLQLIDGVFNDLAKVMPKDKLNEVNNAHKYLKMILGQQNATKNDYVNLAYENFFSSSRKNIFMELLESHMSGKNVFEDLTQKGINKFLKQDIPVIESIENLDTEEFTKAFNTPLADLIIKKGKNGGYLINEQGKIKEVFDTFDSLGKYDLSNDLKFVFNDLSEMRKAFANMPKPQQFAALSSIIDRLPTELINNAIGEHLFGFLNKNPEITSAISSWFNSSKGANNIYQYLASGIIDEAQLKELMSLLPENILAEMSPIGKKIKSTTSETAHFKGNKYSHDEWTDLSFINKNELMDTRKQLIQSTKTDKANDFFERYINKNESEKYNELRYRGAVRNLFMNQDFVRMNPDQARMNANMMDSNFVQNLVSLIKERGTEEQIKKLNPLIKAYDKGKLDFNTLYNVFKGDEDKHQILDNIVKKYWKDLYRKSGEMSKENARKLMPYKGWGQRDSHEKLENYYNIFKDEEVGKLLNNVKSGKKPNIDAIRDTVYNSLASHYEEYITEKSKKTREQNPEIINRFNKAIKLFSDNFDEFYKRKIEGIQKAIAGINKAIFNDTQYEMYNNMIAKQSTRLKPSVAIKQIDELTNVILKYVKDDVKEAAIAIKAAHKDGKISREVWNMFDKAYNKGQLSDDETKPKREQESISNETTKTGKETTKTRKEILTNAVYTQQLNKIINLLRTIQSLLGGTKPSPSKNQAHHNVQKNKNTTLKGEDIKNIVPPHIYNQAMNTMAKPTSNSSSIFDEIRKKSLERMGLTGTVAELKHRSEARRDEENKHKKDQKLKQNNVKEKISSIHNELNPRTLEQIVSPHIMNQANSVELERKLRYRINWLDKILRNINTADTDRKIEKNREEFAEHVDNIGKSFGKFKKGINSVNEKLFNLSYAFPILTPLYSLGMQVGAIGDVVSAGGGLLHTGLSKLTGDEMQGKRRQVSSFLYNNIFSGLVSNEAWNKLMKTLKGKMSSVTELLGAGGEGLISLLTNPYVLAAAAIAATAGVALYAAKKYHDSQIESIKKESKELKTKKKAAEAAYYSSAKTLQNKEINEAQRTDAQANFDKAAAELQTIVNQQSALIERQYSANQSIWGEYGFINKLKLMFEWTGLVEGEHYGKDHPNTTQQIRDSIEYGFGQSFDFIYGGVNSGASDKLYQFFKQHERSFIKMEQNEEELTNLYDFETELINQYGSQDAARQSQEFNQSVQNLANVTNSSKEEIVSYLDWMQNNWIIEQAKEDMQLNADRWLAETRLAAAGEEMQNLGFDKEGLDKTFEWQLNAAAEQILNQTKKEMFLEGLMELLSGIGGVLIQGMMGVLQFLSTFWMLLPLAISNVGLLTAIFTGNDYLEDAQNEYEQNSKLIDSGLYKIGASQDLTLDQIKEGVTRQKYESDRKSGKDRNGIYLSYWADLGNRVKSNAASQVDTSNTTGQVGTSSKTEQKNDNSKKEDNNNENALTSENIEKTYPMHSAFFKWVDQGQFIGENSNMLANTITGNTNTSTNDDNKKENTQNNNKELIELSKKYNPIGGNLYAWFIDDGQTSKEKSEKENTQNDDKKENTQNDNENNEEKSLFYKLFGGDGGLASWIMGDDKEDTSNLPKASEVSSSSDNNANNKDDIDISITGNTITINADNERMKDKEYVKEILRESMIEIANDTKSNLLSILTGQEDNNNNNNNDNGNNPNGGTPS